MWCDINNSQYKKDLVNKLGTDRVKKFSIAIGKPKFQEWFGRGKTIVVNNINVPFVNPILQVINESGDKLNLLEAYKFEGLADVKNTLANYKGIDNTSDFYTVTESPDKFINLQLIKELQRIYPDLLRQVD